MGDAEAVGVGAVAGGWWIRWRDAGGIGSDDQELPAEGEEDSGLVVDVLVAEELSRFEMFYVEGGGIFLILAIDVDVIESFDFHCLVLAYLGS